MKKSEKTQVKSMEAVLAVCLEYPLILALILALANATTAIGLKIQSIISIMGKQQQNNKGVTLTKKQLKKNMLKLGKGTASAIRAYSKTISDATLFAKMRFPISVYFKGDDANAISACRTIYEIVSLIPAAARDPFGVTDAVLLTFKNATNDFETKGSPSTRNVIIKKTALTQILSTLVKEGNSIMRDQILNLSEQLKEDYPEFYIEVNQAAKLIEANTHTKIRVESTVESTGVILPGMNVLVQETGQSGVTNSKGLNIIYLEEGTYHLIFSKENYITMTVKVKVKPGSNTIKAELSQAYSVPEVTPETVNN